MMGGYCSGECREITVILENSTRQYDRGEFINNKSQYFHIPFAHLCLHLSPIYMHFISINMYSFLHMPCPHCVEAVAGNSWMRRCGCSNKIMFTDPKIYEHSYFMTFPRMKNNLFTFFNHYQGKFWEFPGNFHFPGISISITLALKIR